VPHTQGDLEKAWRRKNLNTGGLQRVKAFECNLARYVGKF
jgi:hypothetical protein